MVLGQKFSMYEPSVFALLDRFWKKDYDCCEKYCPRNVDWIVRLFFSGILVSCVTIADVD
jgi:hypothetical protein